MGRLRWFITPETSCLRKLKDNDDRYQIQPDPTEAGAYRLLGVHVVVTGRIPVRRWRGEDDVAIVLVDFSQIAVARDQAPSVKILDQTFGDFDQMAIRVTARYDAAPINPEGDRRAARRHRLTMEVTGYDVADYLGRGDDEGRRPKPSSRRPRDRVRPRLHPRARVRLDGRARSRRRGGDRHRDRPAGREPHARRPRADRRVLRRHGTFEGWTLPELAVLHRLPPPEVGWTFTVDESGDDHLDGRELVVIDVPYDPWGPARRITVEGQS
jgi:hypothetical protein